MRDVQWRNDIADRHFEDRGRSSLLRLLDLRPEGQDGLQEPFNTDGEAGYSRHDPRDRTAVATGTSGHDLVLAVIAARGKTDAVNGRVTAL